MKWGWELDRNQGTCPQGEASSHFLASADFPSTEAGAPRISSSPPPAFGPRAARGMERVGEVRPRLVSPSVPPHPSWPPAVHPLCAPLGRAPHRQSAPLGRAPP